LIDSAGSGQQMDLISKIKSAFKEAEIYRRQGLLDEALDKYKIIEAQIKANRNIRQRGALLRKIAFVIEELNQKLKRSNAPDPPPKVSEDAQALMKDMFTFDDPEIKGSSLLGGAIALAKFGQYEKAIEEFNRLLEYEKFRVEAAKNILWCWMQQKYFDYAVSLFQKWQKTQFFEPNEVKLLRDHFQELIAAAGIQRDIGGVALQKTIEPDSEISDEEILDISATRFSLPGGIRKGESVEFEVSFQSGKYIQFIIPKKEKELIDGLKPGDMLKDVVFYSSVAIFSGIGFLSAKKAIEAGPKRGDYSFSIKIIDIKS
jgi:tetratricopeptide (TPR) repeat protein